MLNVLFIVLLKVNTIYAGAGSNNPETIPIPFAPISKLVKGDICNTNGKSVLVNGWPSSPFTINPFSEPFVNPPSAQVKDTTCRSDGHCIRSFQIDVKPIQKRVFDKTIPGCKNLPATWFLSYNGSIPGPTITIPVGHEAIVRFKNSMDTVNGFFKGSFDPCLPNNGRSGRPISIHNHGSASLSPYDGWAEDETCFNEVKDYVYPNNRANTGWYHDHALHITMDNAYLGLAGFYIPSVKRKHGGCGEPWNLEDIPEQYMMLADKVLDNKCQLYADPLGVHEKSLYGDVNVVNGVPFPVMSLQPKWNRFRIVNSAVSRPWLIKIKDSNLNDISQKICKIIATDGGYRTSPVQYPIEGLLIGVAERYEFVCDFTGYKSNTLYFWNDQDDNTMRDTPYFCNSHLIAKINIGNVITGMNAVFNDLQDNPGLIRGIDKTLSASNIQTAIAMANNGQAHREFVFGRSNGHWTINGETWDTNKIAASDVGQNTWELWRISTGVVGFIQYIFI